MKAFLNILMLVSLMIFDLGFSQKKNFDEDAQTRNISQLLDDFNRLAARADYQNYFDCFAEEATFIGTDASEVWSKKEFMEWAKPFFEKGKTWNFTSLKRNIYFSPDGNFAWFDELLDTQMKICRGSGVLEKKDGKWKIRQYVLSMTIPNEVADEVVATKSPMENPLLLKLRKP